MLAQHGFLTREALCRVVDATRREIIDCPFTRDEPTIARLAAQSRDDCAYGELICHDAAKCEKLIRCDRFWRGACPLGGKQCVLEEIRRAAHVPGMVRRSAEAAARAKRAAAFREAAEAEWRRRLRA